MNVFTLELIIVIAGLLLLIIVAYVRINKLNKHVDFLDATLLSMLQVLDNVNSSQRQIFSIVSDLSKNINSQSKDIHTESNNKDDESKVSVNTQIKHSLDTIDQVEETTKVFTK